MKHFHVGGNVRWRLLSVMRSGKTPLLSATADAPPDVDDRYRITAFRTLIHRAVGALPPLWREWAAEYVLRRADAPGPAAEHVVQYLLRREG
jgi:hypothetical protein